MAFTSSTTRLFRLLCVLACVLFIAGCGGGSGSTSSGATPESNVDIGTTQPATSAPTSVTPSGVTPTTSPIPTPTTSPTPTPTTSPTPTPTTSPTPTPVSALTIAAHTIKVDVSGYGTSPMTTPPVNTPASGSIILVQVLTQNTGTFSSLTDNMGNTYTRIGGAQTYAGVGAGSYLYACVNAKGGSGQTWSLNKAPTYQDNEATLFVVVVSGASALGQVTYSNTQANNSASPLVTTGPNSLVVSFWGPADFTGSQSAPTNDYYAPSGWTRLDIGNNSLNSNSGADAWQTVPAAGTTVNPMWSAQTAINNPTSSMWLVEVKP